MVNIHLNGVIVTQNGLSAGTDGEKLIAAVSGPEFTVCIDLNIGKGAFTIYTSDLSPEYVDFNRTEYSAVKKK
jgi:glutamate N-acetyltransferase/amino-acid N-acetyltransferase